MSTVSKWCCINSGSRFITAFLIAVAAFQHPIFGIIVAISLSGLNTVLFIVCDKRHLRQNTNSIWCWYVILYNVLLGFCFLLSDEYMFTMAGILAIINILVGFTYLFGNLINRLSNEKFIHLETSHGNR